MHGWVDKIELKRWYLKPIWDPEERIPVHQKEIVSIQMLNGKRLYLSQLEPLRVKEETIIAPKQPYRMDKSCQGDPIMIGDHSYPWGIGVHANSELTFNSGKAFKKFQTLIGIDSHSGGRGSVIFSIYTDGNEVYKSPVVHGTDTEPIPVELSVEGVDELTLKVEDAGDLDLGDMADWVVAQLLR